jgi:hypothetical protein
VYVGLVGRPAFECLGRPLSAAGNPIFFKKIILRKYTTVSKFSKTRLQTSYLMAVGANRHGLWRLQARAPTKCWAGKKMQHFQKKCATFFKMMTKK